MSKLIDLPELNGKQFEREVFLELESDNEIAFDDDFVHANNGREMDSPMHPTQDLRFGGEDLSGVSEWSMRAHSPEFDDGSDASDIKRSDTDILNGIWESIGDEESDVRDLEIAVRAAEVFVQGKVKEGGQRENLINLILSVPGVRNVYDGVVVTAG